MQTFFTQDEIQEIAMAYEIWKDNMDKAEGLSTEMQRIRRMHILGILRDCLGKGDVHIRTDRE